MNWVPENSRRARGFALYAALRGRGRRGESELVERCCDLALAMAARMAAHPRLRIVNEVALNQVLVSVDDGDQLRTREVIRRVQEDGTCWLGSTRWHERELIRISICHWATTAEDVARSADAILAAVDATPAAGPAPIT